MRGDRKSGTVTGEVERRRSNAVRLLGRVEEVFLVAGVLLFVFLLHRLGAVSLWNNLRLIGWGFLLVVGQEIVAVAANTFGWFYAFPVPRPFIPAGRLLAARVAGDGINCVTPTATLGGEFVRARMLGDSLDSSSVWASVAVAKMTQTIAQVAFISGGLLFISVENPLPPAVRRGLLGSVFLFAVLVLSFSVLQRYGLFTMAFRLLDSCFGMPSRIGVRLEHVDAKIRGIYGGPFAFLLSFLFFFLGWAWGIVEMFLLLSFLEVGVGWKQAVTIEVLSVTIDALFFFVPAKAGTQEGGKALIFSLLALDPAKGLALGVARRIRELSWAGVGLMVFYRWRRR